MIMQSMYFTGVMRVLTNVLLTIIVGHLFFNREKVYIFYYALFISVMCSLQVILSVSFQYMTYLLNIHFYSLEVYSTAIISNIFDNAIESARECSIEREIILKIDKFNDFIVINLVNSLERLPEERSGKFKSTKKDHLGLGLENVRLAVERYEGNLKIDYDTKVFKVNIVIPINIEGSCYER